MEIMSKNLKETEDFAKSFLDKLVPQNNQATVVTLSGNLGAGKTAFVQFVAKLLGVKENLTSPTFVIIKTYPLTFSYQLPATPRSRAKLTTGHGNYKLFVHIDAYRLKSGEELKKLDWQEMLADPKNLIFIEWSKNVSNAIPKNSINIRFEFIDETTRKITSL